MLGRSIALAISLLAVLVPALAFAGGPEFPAGGTRSLGRGAAGFARADDPTVMTRNPALLADLWDDQAMMGAHLLLVDSCFRPTGGYDWGVSQGDVSDFGDGPVYSRAQDGDTDLDGNPLVGYQHDPYPRVCYQGPAPFLPQLALTTKLADDLGVGIGFFPPDNAGLNQWGNRDGTVDTPEGRRPNPLRFLRSHLNVSFFTLLGGAGYRVNDWLRIGAALQWNVAAFSAITWTTATLTRDPRNDIRTKVFGRDLFIPGFIVSAQLKPLDELDVALGFKWLDNVNAKAKLDITSGAFGTGEVFEFLRDGQIIRVGSSIPVTTHNQLGEVDAPPIWVPQAAIGVRYAQRLRPATRDWKLAHAVGDGAVVDSMTTELWDVEVDAVYYFNSVYDRSAFFSDVAVINLQTINEDGVVSPIASSVGKCKTRDADRNCIGRRVTQTLLGGKDQITVRAGGDYNLFPGLFAVRAGASYEAAGQKIELLNVMNYMLERIGVHAGFTLRIAGKTDLSFAFARFFQQRVRLQVNESDTAGLYPPRYKMDEYNFAPGLGVSDMDEQNENAANGFDGVAGLEVPNGAADRISPGPFYVNAGSYYFDLDVASLTLTQHF